MISRANQNDSFYIFVTLLILGTNFFEILILTWLKAFFSNFPKLNLARLISQKQLKNYQAIA